MTTLATHPVAIDSLFNEGEEQVKVESGQRFAHHQADREIIRDSFPGADCIFIRSSNPLSLRIDTGILVHPTPCGGWILRYADSERPFYWIPQAPALRQVAQSGHILKEAPFLWDQVQLQAEAVELSFPAPGDAGFLDCVIWRFSDTTLLQELESLTAIESRQYYLLGSHTRYDRPADVYQHLVHGWVYENRYSWPHRRRICSENDAHGLCLTVTGLYRNTNKRLYRLLQAQLLLSVLARQSDDGGFYHGEWTDNMESHYRLHCSAMHLMMDSLSETPDPQVRQALARGMAFVADKYDTTDLGPWFFHDQLETSAESMQSAPFKWWPGKAFGKAPQNMLVLNTQLDTLVALDRYASLTGDATYAGLIRDGYTAAFKVLESKPMEWLYRLIFSAINLTFLPSPAAARLPVFKRAWKRIGWQVFAPRLPRLKTRFPRLVMPGGYIDRELSLQTWAYDYLPINLMDLIRASRGTHRSGFDQYISGILQLVETTHMPRRWLEARKSHYALGFYAEALYLLCLKENNTHHIAMLAEALLLSNESQQGMPPSILGGNREATSFVTPLPDTRCPDTVLVNLPGTTGTTCLIVNTGPDPVRLREVLNDNTGSWHIPDQTLQPRAHTLITA